MPAKPYSWKDGPDAIQPHSIAKHRVLRSYLAAYFKTLVSNPNQDVLSLTLIDGFAGGGHYIHSEMGTLVKGSPFIFLEATQEAEYSINQARRKPVRFDVDYFFVEPNRHACKYLEKVLIEGGYGDQIGKSVHLRKSTFQEEVDNIIAFIKRKNPRNGRSIFALDQYGYKDVPTHLIKSIFTNLPSAEVILTFGIDSFINYANDGTFTQNLLKQIGIPDVLRGRSIAALKDSDRDWRLFIQSTLYRSLVGNCGATYYTPFFIRNGRGHGDYWLIHLSQHYKARDVMTEVHWDNNNYFIHYGGAGLDMFQMVGYDPAHDFARLGQDSLGFEFDDIARKASIVALQDQIPRKVYANDDGVNFDVLFATTCNNSPASASIYKGALEHLIQHKEIEVISIDGVRRRSALQIKPSDQIVPPAQRSIFLQQ
ncbi:three-Cys-motif partner protein [Nitrosospira sp. Nl5]|uniref:three-Cys-motif partner protein TcmP n=1 Tax=Nitrosospira sp. Nl5 TaxID=200120 RepID=UPI00088750B1|nr:three-Cys-motif partner protein TcmP [Nitrosospira sp. Nl5]SCX91912.1 three-Cys-motif partner protein [Nitrosospira sp. Nl5]